MSFGIVHLTLFFANSFINVNLLQETWKWVGKKGFLVYCFIYLLIERVVVQLLTGKSNSAPHQSATFQTYKF